MAAQCLPLSPSPGETGGAGGGDRGVAGGSSGGVKIRPWSRIVSGETESSEEPNAASTPQPESIDKANVGVGDGGGRNMQWSRISNEPNAPQPESMEKANAGSTAKSESIEKGNDDDCKGNVAPPRKPAWNMPLNDVVEPVSIMGGAVSWPSLSDSTRPGQRSVNQSEASQGQVINQPSPREGNNGNLSATANKRRHSNAKQGGVSGPQQRPVRPQGGGNSNNGNSSRHDGFSHGPPPPFPVYQLPFGTLSVRGTRPMGGPVSQPLGSSNHTTPRNSSGRGNFCIHPRRAGQNRKHGGQSDQDRRDAGVALRVAPVPPFIPPPPPPGTPPPYGSLPMMRPFPVPIGFDMAPPHAFIPTAPPDSLTGAPLIAPVPLPPVFFPFMEPNLHLMLLHQIDYYFSDHNLAGDDFLRSNMDDEGWVDVSLIANFNRVAKLTSNTSFILDCMRASNVVEVEGDKLRRRDDWRKWLNTPASLTNDSAPRTTPESSNDTLCGFGTKCITR